MDCYAQLLEVTLLAQPNNLHFRGWYWLRSLVSSGTRSGSLLVCRALVLQPPRWVTVGRILMCPVNYAPLGIPFILAAEGHRVALAKVHDPRRYIDVVRDQKRLARLERQDKALVPPAMVVIVKNPAHDPSSFDLYVARALLEGAREHLVALG